jgi:ribosomal protein S18 acetylase RimI-like enzyme
MTMAMIDIAALAAPTAGDNVAAFIDAWTFMTSRYPGHRIATDAGVATTFSNQPLPFLNISTLDRPLAEPAAFRDACREARARAEDYGHGSMLALSGDWAPDDWEDLAAEAGWLRSMALTAMAADRLRPPRRAQAPLEFLRIEASETARDLGLVNALAYAMPVELFDCLDEMALWRDGGFGIVGYDDGRPVTGAAAFALGDRIYVAMVASAPGTHGRGYGEAAMRRVISDAERAVGARRIWLHATAMGEPLYRSMGFEGGATLALLHLASGEQS